MYVPPRSVVVVARGAPSSDTAAAVRASVLGRKECTARLPDKRVPPPVDVLDLLTLAAARVGLGRNPEAVNGTPVVHKLSVV